MKVTPDRLAVAEAVLRDCAEVRWNLPIDVTRATDDLRAVIEALPEPEGEAAQHECAHCGHEMQRHETPGRECSVEDCPCDLASLAFRESLRQQQPDAGADDGECSHGALVCEECAHARGVAEGLARAVLEASDYTLTAAGRVIHEKLIRLHCAAQEGES